MIDEHIAKKYGVSPLRCRKAKKDTSVIQEQDVKAMFEKIKRYAESLRTGNFAYWTDDTIRGYQTALTSMEEFVLGYSPENDK